MPFKYLNNWQNLNSGMFTNGFFFFKKKYFNLKRLAAIPPKAWDKNFRDNHKPLFICRQNY